MAPETMDPGAGDAGAGSLEAGQRSEAKHNRRRRARQGMVCVIHGRDRTRRIVVAGRQLWCLRQLLAAGPRGCTPLHDPAPRWSSYVARLRAKGLDIETRREKHVGAYPGQHGVYILHSDVELEPLADG